MTDTDARTDPPPEGDEEDDPASHLDELPDGCGCAEVWEHLSERRGE